MDNLLTIRDLRTHFFLDEGTVRAVENSADVVDAVQALRSLFERSVTN